MIGPAPDGVGRAGHGSPERPMRACEHRAVTKGAAEATDACARNANRATEAIQRKPRQSIPTSNGSSRDGRSVERACSGQRFTNSNAAKRKNAACRCGTRDRRRPRTWMSGHIYG